jgi:hypothetical protein
MNDDLRTLILSASFGLLVAGSIIYGTGFDGSVAGIKIGPAHSLLKVAGR